MENWYWERWLVEPMDQTKMASHRHYPDPRQVQTGFLGGGLETIFRLGGVLRYWRCPRLAKSFLSKKVNFSSAKMKLLNPNDGDDYRDASLQDVWEVAMRHRPTMSTLWWPGPFPRSRCQVQRPTCRSRTTWSARPSVVGATKRRQRKMRIPGTRFWLGTVCIFRDAPSQPSFHLLATSHLLLATRREMYF